MLPEVIEQAKIDEVLIAIPSATGAQMRRIIEICKSCDARYRTLPEIGAIIDGKVSIKSLRDVKYEDLLRRPPVSLDTTEISRYLQGKRVLVTGAGGSIGSELCRQIIRFDPEELILVDASEVNLFNIQMELQHELNFPRYRCILSRVQDRPLMDECLQRISAAADFSCRGLQARAHAGRTTPGRRFLTMCWAARWLWIWP